MTEHSGDIARLQTQISQPETTFQHCDLEKDTFSHIFLSYINTFPIETKKLGQGINSSKKHLYRMQYDTAY